MEVVDTMPSSFSCTFHSLLLHVPIFPYALALLQESPILRVQSHHSQQQYIHVL